MKEKGNKDFCEFTEADFDFSDVILPELLPCLYFEYARESRTARSEVESVRKQMKQINRKQPDLTFGPQVQSLVQAYVVESLSFPAGFPHTPWSKLSQKEKEHLLRMVGTLHAISRYASTWQDPPLTLALNQPGTMTLDAWKKQCIERRQTASDAGTIKFGFFAINLEYGPAALIEEFTAYLRHFEGKPKIEFPPAEKEATKCERRGRKGIRDALNALGAMRLRYQFATFRQAQEKIKLFRNKPHGMFYDRRYNFNRACDAALKHFQTLFGWLDSANSIHFTEGWAGSQK